MSIIHEALKKVDGARHGYSAAPSSGAKASSLNQRTKRLVIFGGLAAFMVLLGLAYMISDGPVKTEGKKEAPSATQIQAMVEVKPSPSVHNIKGIELYQAGSLKEAAAEFNEALKLDPQNPAYHNNLGMALMSVDDTAGAEEAFKKAIALKPDYPEALNNYGALLEKKNQLKKALENYKKASAISPAYGEAHLNAGIALEKSGDIEGALASYDAFLKSTPDGALKTEVNKKVMQLRSGLILKGAKRERL